MTNFRIVTNGKRFRIQYYQEAQWKFVQRTVLSPDGHGCSYLTPVEFRFYIRALKRVAYLIKAEVRRTGENQWQPVNDQIHHQ